MAAQANFDLRRRVCGTLASLCLLALAATSLSGCLNGDVAQSTPVDFRFACSAGLSAEECTVEKRFADYLAKDSDAAVWRYRQHFGNEIDTDNARELSADYAPDGIESTSARSRVARTKWSNAVQMPAGLLAREIYRRVLASDTVVFTAGGAAAGKSSVVESNPDVRSRLANAFAICDTTLSGEESSLARIEQALTAGKKVHIIYVYRDPMVAWVHGALPRAMSNGRTVGLKFFAAGHVGAARVLAAIVRKYGNDRRLSYEIIDNSLGSGKQKVVTGDIGKFLGERTQTEADLLPKLETALDEEFKKGKISKEVYDASK